MLSVNLAFSPMVFKPDSLHDNSRQHLFNASIMFLTVVWLKWGGFGLIKIAFYKQQKLHTFNKKWEKTSRQHQKSVKIVHNNL